MQIVLAQLNPCVGDIPANVARALSLLSAHKDADLILFTEGFVSGHPCADLVLKPGFLDATEAGLKTIQIMVTATNGPAILIGAPVRGPEKPYNGVVFMTPHGGQLVATRTEPAGHGSNHDRQNFAYGQMRSPFSWKGLKLGVGVSEEIENPDIARRMAGDLADILIFLNANPYTRDNHEKFRLAHARQRAKETGRPVICMNPVGGVDEIVYDGASFVLDAQGKTTVQLAAFSEEVATMTYPSIKTQISVYPSSLAADYMAAVLGVRDYVQKSGFSDVLIEMSGELDSAMAAAIAVDALGPKRVHAIHLPPDTKVNPIDFWIYDVCKRLGIDCEKISMERLMNAAASSFKSVSTLVGNTKKLSFCNLETNAEAKSRAMTRLRMSVIMTISEQKRHMLVTAGNKSELSIGNATLHGDMAGAYNVLKDFYRTDVTRLARYRNAHCPVGSLGAPGVMIPEKLLETAHVHETTNGPASDTLMGPYKILDALLKALIDDDLETDAALAQAANDMKGNLTADLEATFLTRSHALMIAQKVGETEYKRRQAAPGPRIAPRAFGRPRRYPIVNKFAPVSEN